ncbi:Na+/H+ antiporter [Paraburkholderia caballeronis]|uniref:Sodium/proton antiporter, CPA1 family n=1 Tax=Paraburkholderia caballeronis TaxID=416943 RepID=A0A1H7FST7_9BURK|nr:Na+/H+ antiporter [Paraburkholderia caballeronis]PXW24853.1 sodium/proton antiporter (CPA1 family) [Paraburkholderia caballeronis]PXX00583.1 sodium/proton antiporter (CPA1 family) [Paraburkholderia caballeronis]RAJ98646.1 sodium/proton antiporter (CPA1 family) [Paraburkholderia caballeronis]SEE68997.1 sodium/proton antiporter, CPA1 family [Paraburkholderia caballeronis]SEK29019.1 sodium/proton antiporter, CPA1 family [Paraburkholderia caballeronis]
MNNVAFFHSLLWLVGGAGALTWVAARLAIPPAVVLLLGGSAIALLGGRTSVDMDPNLILAAVMPPLLMSSSFYTAWQDFRREVATITSLVLGAVVFTTVAVAVVVHAVEPTLAWPACFALGAIVSPPDAVAAKAMLQRAPLPARLVTVLEGESLVNDASGLLLYQMAIAAALAGQFTATHAGSVFVTLTVIGVAVGVVCGYLMTWLIQRLREPMLSIVLTFLVAWASYAIAEELHGSGVLSVVACGMVLGIRQHEAFDAHTRIKAEATWETIVFVLDALVFILIGLALHGIVVRMEHAAAMLDAGLRVALPATGAVVLARLAWVGLAIWLPSQLSARLGRTDRPWQFGEAVVLGWAGMRGVVSLAAALALPAAFPGRDLIVFSTFVVIFATLVLQGGSLGAVVRLVRLRRARSTTMSELEARSHTFRASLKELERIRKASAAADADIVQRLIDEYRIRVHNNENAHAEGGEHVERRARHLRLELELVAVSRQELLRLHRESRIRDAVLHRIEAELDLEELRLHRLLEP